MGGLGGILVGEKTTNIERSSAEELGCRYLLRQNKIFKGFSPPNGFLSSGTGASIIPNVCRSVGRSVGLSVGLSVRQKKFYMN